MNLFHPLFVFLASLTQQDLARQVIFLREENRILRSRLPSRIRVTSAEKTRLIKLGRDLGVKLRNLISIVSYSTFRRWIREAESRHVDRKQSASTTTPCVGRPRTASDIRDLVLKLATENSWGYTRILGELRKLGINSISRSTIKAILKEHHIAPAPDRPSGSWSEFIRIYAAAKGPDPHFPVQAPHAPLPISIPSSPSAHPVRYPDTPRRHFPPESATIFNRA